MELENISHYKIIRTIGSGGMGEVYLAEDTRLKRKVALKMLPIEAGADDAKVARFEKEARAASALSHPNILTVYDVGEVDSFRYIVTEFVDGQTLRDYFSHGRVPLRKALDIITDISKALSAAHDAGIVHRDIKPENIMIRKDGLVKVLDFGLAKLTEAETAEDALVVTAPGMIMGTPKYMSPEQIRGYDVDQRSDIFSLGVVFYEMVAGVAPFEGPTISDVIAAVLTREPEPLLQHNPKLPAAIQSFLDRCLDKNAASRYQTMTRLIFDLERLKNRTDPEILDQNVTLEMGTGRDSLQPALAPTTLQRPIDTSSENINTKTFAASSVARKKPGLPGLVWLGGGLMSIFLVAVVILLFDQFIVVVTSFEATVVLAPPGSRILVDDSQWGTMNEDGSMKLTNLKPGRRVIKIVHPNFKCEPQEVFGEAGVTPVTIIARCVETRADTKALEDCANIRLGEFDKAERCFDAALAALPDPFTADDLIRALNILIINFDAGKFDVPGDRLAALQKGAEYIKQLPPDIVLEIGGHTDNVGNAASNQTLSENRAFAVKAKLMTFGVRQETLQIRGYGSSSPKTDNNTEQGKFLNRRIQYSIVKK